MVPGSTIGIMVFNIVFCTAIPIVLCIVFARKFHASVVPFFIGCAVWFVFAMILEQILHVVVLGSPAGGTIQGSPWLYGLYGGLAAGVFEETGRFLAMKFCLKKHYANRYNALMYGAGHGGFEALFLIVPTYVSNLVVVAMINSNMVDSLMAAVPAAQQAPVREAVDALVQTNSFYFLAAAYERIPAVVTHIALSVLVWAAVTKGKTIFFPLAIFLHFLLDFVTVVVSRNGAPVIVTEIVVTVLAAGIAVIGYRIWKKELGTEQ